MRCHPSQWHHAIIVDVWSCQTCQSLDIVRCNKHTSIDQQEPVSWCGLKGNFIQKHVYSPMFNHLPLGVLNQADSQMILVWSCWNSCCHPTSWKYDCVTQNIKNSLRSQNHCNIPEVMMWYSTLNHLRASMCWVCEFSQLFPYTSIVLGCWQKTLGNTSEVPADKSQTI